MQLKRKQVNDRMLVLDIFAYFMRGPGETLNVDYLFVYAADNGVNENYLNLLIQHAISRSWVKDVGHGKLELTLSGYLASSAGMHM
jgi:hypothetical protein